MYATANVSGGHLNPAVTLAQCLTGHSSWGRGGLYVIAQVLGGIWGALVQVLLVKMPNPPPPHPTHTHTHTHTHTSTRAFSSIAHRGLQVPLCLLLQGLS